MKLFLGSLFLFMSTLMACNQGQKNQENEEQQNSIKKDTSTQVVEVEPFVEYGLLLDSFSLTNKTVKRNQFLADILLAFDVPYSKINAIATKSKKVFDVRKIKAGNFYCVARKNSDSAGCDYFIYEIDPVNYVVFDLRDSVNIYKGQKEVSSRLRQVAGTINSSLYQTLDDKDISPAIAIKLSEVYAWSIDFYRIQKGDRFKVIYEERLVDGEVIGSGKIVAARFDHFDDSHYAFYFEQDSTGDYFDTSANSLRKAFLKAPLRFTRISSRYTMRRYHPVQKRYKAHLGTDYAAPTGTPIRSVGDGVVIAARYSKYNGNYVKIRHNSVYTTQYLHMSKIRSGIRNGKSVKQGDIIGYVGATGLATGPHLCYRFWKNGQQVDPFKEKIPPAEPVKEEYHDKYMAHMKDWKKELEQISFEEKLAQK